MKIGIFGCSYADENSSPLPEMHQKSSKPWARLLRENYNHDVTNFGKSASSVFFSYQNFLKHYHEFEKNIIIVTTTARLYLPQNQKHPHWTVNYKEAQHKVGYVIAKFYFENIFNPIEYDHYRELILEKLRTYKNTLVIDVNEALGFIAQKEYNFFQETFLNKISMMNDNRYNHLSEQANVYVADQIQKWIETNEFSLNVKDFPLPRSEDAEIYFPKDILKKI